MPAKRRRKANIPLRAGGPVEAGPRERRYGKAGHRAGKTKGWSLVTASFGGIRTGLALVELVPERSHVVLKKIWAVECGQGYGSRLMQKVCKAADAANMKLRLETRPFKLSLLNRWRRKGDPPEEKTRENVEDWLCRFRYLPTPAGKRRNALNKKGLKVWYGRFGFVQAGRTNIMVREPCSHESETKLNGECGSTESPEE